MPFAFSAVETNALLPDRRCTEDRRNNPVRGRKTKFRLLQQNMLEYTFPFVPGFAGAGVNNLPFAELVARPTANAIEEGRLFHTTDFEVTPQQIAKVEGDIFEEVIAAIHWNLAARWNAYVAEDGWAGTPHYPKPTTKPQPNRQVAVLSLPRNYDWVRLLVSAARDVITGLRDELALSGLALPTSTPDILVVALPAEHHDEGLYRTELPDLSLASQFVLRDAHKLFENRIEPGEFILAIAAKKSLRSDRLYQPLYEANIMQLLLEGRLDAPQVDFEVHTLESAGTAAIETYSAASLAAVATRHANPHRAVRELYEPATASEMVRRFLAFLDHRMALVP